MPDGLQVQVHYREALRELTLIDRRVDRATMWALREAGRKVKQSAKKQAPVYKGKRADIPKGRLKKSIHSSKKLKRTGGGWSLTVAPRGYPAQAYAPKQEERTPFMQPAFRQISSQAPAIAAGAWARAIRRR